MFRFRVACCVALCWTMRGAVGADEPLAVYKRADDIALKTPKTAEGTVAALAGHLTGKLKTDKDKARAIYRWITDRIAYDVELRDNPNRNFADCTPDKVLADRKNVCAGYANLFEALGREAGLECVVVVGHYKPHTHVPGRKPVKPDHAWNAVKIDGKWQLLDSTHGAGSVGPGEDGAEAYSKNFSEWTFLTPPDQFVLTHLPEDPKWQMLPTPVTEEEYFAQPYIGREVIRNFPLAQIKARLKAKDFKGFVSVHPITAAPRRPKVLVAPLDAVLKAGAKTSFRIDAPGATAVALIEGTKFHPMTRQGTAWSISGGPAAGVLKVSLQYGAKEYWNLLQYKVE